MSILNPLSISRISWNCLLTLFIIYSALLIPFCCVFSIPISGTLFWINLAINLFLFIDIGLNFFSDYFDNGLYIKKLKTKALHYFKSWFFIDLIVTIPWDEFIVLIYPKLLPYKNVIALIRLFWIIRIYRFLKQLNRIVTINLTVVRMIRFTISIIIYSHWIACFWLYIPTIEWQFGITTNWMSINDLLNKEPFIQYIRSIYWVITTMTTVGYGDIAPHNSIETIFTIIVMISGVSVYAYIIGNVASLIGNLDASAQLFQKQTTKLNNFLRVQKLPKPLKDRIQLHIHQVWSNEKYLTTSQAIDFLPKTLREDIALYITKNIISNTTLFNKCDKGIHQSIATMVNSERFFPGDYIIRKGQLANEMYFISVGEVDVINEETGKVTSSIEQGGVFGEIALLYPNSTRTSTVKARSRVECYTLKRDDFNIILNHYPDFAKHIKTIADSRKNN